LQIEIIYTFASLILFKAAKKDGLKVAAEFIRHLMAVCRR
jgi:hypothetical protein